MGMVLLTMAVGSKVTYCAVCFQQETMLKTRGSWKVGWISHCAKKLKAQLSNHRLEHKEHLTSGCAKKKEKPADKGKTHPTEAW